MTGVDDTGAVYRLFAGRRFDLGLGIEGGHLDLGETAFSVLIYRFGWPF